MPSSPKIPKETILEHALQMVIREGYAALNIKALARDIGCSTQPVSWHFKNMEGLRSELGGYALRYANRKLCPMSKGLQAFREVGCAYVGIAFDEPHLFKYLYMSADSGCYLGGFEALAAEEDTAALMKDVAGEFDISPDRVSAFCRDMIIYTHGLASFVASGLITATKQEVHEMMLQVFGVLLRQAGVCLP